MTHKNGISADRGLTSFSFPKMISTLFGMVSGIAATPLREPFATRMVLEYLGPGVIEKRHLKQATTLLPDDPSIPLEIRAYLTENDQAIVRGG